MHPLVTDGRCGPEQPDGGRCALTDFKLMNHFSIWQWTDYVRVVGDDVARSAMDAHLSSGCLRCQRTVSVLGGVASTARAEADYGPPECAVRYAQAVYSLYRPEKASFSRLVARLVHDSIREPLPAGLRAEDRHSRHALYEAGGYCLDLQLEQQLTSGLVTLIGQLADRNEPAAGTAGVPVWLMERKRLVSSALCNRFGEFQLEYPALRDLRLCLPLRPAKKLLEVSLDRLTPGLPGRPRRAAPARRGTTRRPGRR